MSGCTVRGSGTLAVAKVLAEILDEGKVVRRGVGKAAGEELANLEATSLKPDYRLRADRRWEHRHVALAWLIWRPDRHAGCGKSRQVDVPPVLSDQCPRGAFRQRFRVLCREHKPILWRQGDDNGVAVSRHHAGRRSFVPATLMPRDRHAPASTSVLRYSHASYISGTTHVGLSCATIRASIGRTWPLLVTMSTLPTMAGSFFSASVILSATPAICASSRVIFRSSSAVAYLLGPARAYTVPPAIAASTGVTA